MKRLRKFLITFILFLSFCSSKNIFAATGDLLISVGNVTVNNNTTIDEISRVLGEPKLVTDSAFGGKAYTFYTDNNYSNYLYVETLSSGVIASYGSIDTTFKTSTYSYGDPYNFKENGILSGYMCSDDGTIIAALFYNLSSYESFGGRKYEQFVSDYKGRYVEEPIKYLKSIVQHAVIMYNALSTKLGNKTELKFDEDFFYINEQLKESTEESPNESKSKSIREYMTAMNKSTTYVKAIAKPKEDAYIDNKYYLINPLMFAQYATANKSTKFGEKNIAVFDFSEERHMLTAIAISPDAFENVEAIELLPEEQSKLSSGRHEYTNAMSLLNKDSQMYEKEPKASVASALEAGKLMTSKEDGIVAYVNAIRTAAGTPKLIKSEEAFDVAQHIATLMTYRYNVLGQDIMHQPPQPEGVSEEFWHRAIGYGLGYTENLGRSSQQTTVKAMTDHINKFIDDSSETPSLIFSHRQKLLSARYRNFGFGISPLMSANEFKGSQSSDVFLEAWPSNGITFIETLSNVRFNWTAQFTSKYTIQNDTTATIECLNTGDKWEFDKEEKVTGKWYQTDTDVSSSLNNRVIMYDSTIIPSAGYVYKITLHNVKDNSTGSLTDYSYRSVFEYADETAYPTRPDSIGISSNGLKLVKGEKDIYYVPVGKEAKVIAKIPADLVDRKVSWYSSDERVTVTQNGTIIANSLTDEDVVITVGYTGSNVTAHIVVRPYIALEEIQLSEDDVTYEQLEYNKTNEVSGELYIKYIPEEATEYTEINWKVASQKNPSIEYDLDDPTLSRVIKVDVDENDSKKVYIHALDAEPDNNIFYVIAYVTGLNDTFSGRCKIAIHVPLKFVTIKSATQGLSVNPGSDGNRTLNINYDTFGEDYFNLAVDYTETNTTESKVIDWQVENSNFIENYDTNGRFKINKEGTTKITANSSIPTVKDNVIVTVTATLKSLALAGNSNIMLKDGVDNVQDKLTLTRTPVIDNDEIEYTVDNDELAEVSTDGVVTFKKPGSVEVTAKSKELPSVFTTFRYNVQKAISSIDFKQKVVHVNKNESYSQQVTALPADNTFKNRITYQCEDRGVATIIGDGTILALKKGQTKVIATVPAECSATGKKMTTEYTVIVDVPLNSAEITDGDKITMIINSEHQFSVELYPQDTTDEVEIVWDSDAPEYVTINPETGVAEAKQVGKAQIKATIKDKTNGQDLERVIEVEVVDYLKGDLDRNGQVDTADAAVALNLFKYKNFTDEDMAIGDLDENGLIDTADAAEILNIFKYKTKQ